MNKKKLKGLALVMAIVVVMFCPVRSQAEEDKEYVNVSAMEEFDTFDQDSQFIGKELNEAVALETIGADEFEAMNKEGEIQSYSTTEIKQDAYEPNNSRETAFPYKDTKKLTGNAFTEGYVNSNCHVEGDEDWFVIDMTLGEKYDVVLKNLYRKDRHIYIWENNFDGTYTKWGNPTPKTGMPEHYTFYCSVNTSYYIQIAGGEPDAYSFFFAVEKQGKVNTALWPSEVLSGKTVQ